MAIELRQKVHGILSQLAKLAELIQALDQLRQAGDHGQAFHLSLNSAQALPRFIDLIASAGQSKDDDRNFAAWEKNTHADQRLAVKVLWNEYVNIKSQLINQLASAVQS